jgi:hypothetical protein
MAELMIACFAIDAFDDHEAQVFKLRRDSAVYLSKWPGGMVSVRRRLRFDPHFHVICMLRDPRDVVTSRHGKDMARYWAPLRIWKRNFRYARPVLDHARVIPVRYEDLVTQPDKVQAEIARRLPFLRARRLHRVSSAGRFRRPRPSELLAVSAPSAPTASATGAVTFRALPDSWPGTVLLRLNFSSLATRRTMPGSRRSTGSSRT